jgi:hypothetical protein
MVCVEVEEECGVVLCCVVWCGAVWCGVVSQCLVSPITALHTQNPRP